jgi:plasmid stabilization system protein ParE
MEKYQITPEAVSDLFEIWNFISQDNPEAADRVEEAVFRACSLPRQKVELRVSKVNLTYHSSNYHLFSSMRN